jgi:hypothetical protein
MKESKFAKRDKMSRKVVSIFVVSFFLISALGYTYSVVFGRDIAEIPTSNTSDRPDTDRRSTMISGLLGEQEPIILQDGSTVSTLLESPDPGLLEVGVMISGPRASTVTIDDIILVTSSGSEFRATELNKVEDGIAFTINATLTADERITLIWSENKVKLVELT